MRSIAYGEWMRVLKTGGVLLNFDANYGKEDVADTKGLPEAHAHFKVGNEMLEECERIKSHSRSAAKTGRVRCGGAVRKHSGRNPH